MTALRRAVKAAIDVDFNVQAFAEDLMNWGDATRIKWTFDYFGWPHLATAAPSAATDTANAEPETETETEETSR